MLFLELITFLEFNSLKNNYANSGLAESRYASACSIARDTEMTTWL